MTGGGGHIGYLDQHRIECKPPKAVQSFYLQPWSWAIIFKYTCCHMSLKIKSQKSHYTPFTDDGKGKTAYLDKQFVHCVHGFLSYIHLQRDRSKTKVRYHYKCLDVYKTLKCYDQSSSWRGLSGTFPLAHHKVSCTKPSYFLTGFHFERNLQNKHYRYIFRCCTA